MADDRKPSAGKTIVMIHGAFAGPWCFDRFRPVFEQRGATNIVRRRRGGHGYGIEIEFEPQLAGPLLDKMRHHSSRKHKGSSLPSGLPPYDFLPEAVPYEPDRRGPRDR